MSRECPRCGKTVHLGAEHAGKPAKCTECWATVPPEAGEVVQELEYEERRRPLLYAAGWGVSLALHCLLLIGFGTVTWLTVGDPGTHERPVGVVMEREAGPKVTVAPPPAIEVQPSAAPDLKVETPKVEPVALPSVEAPQAAAAVALPEPVTSQVATTAMDFSAIAVGGNQGGVSMATGGPTVPVGGVGSDFSGLPGLLRNRSGAAKQAALTRYGGHKTLPAVEKGLAWLAENQSPEGGWGQGPGMGRLRGARCPGVSGLAMLAFLGAGHSTRGGKYKPTVEKAVAFLLSQSKREGDRLVFHGDMYRQGIATFALAEECAMSRNSATRRAATGGVLEILAAQYQDGGWRYGHRGMGADTSVSGWQVMALKAAKEADISVPAAAYDGAKRFLHSVKSVETGRGAVPRPRGRSAPQPEADSSRSDGEGMVGFGYTSPGATWTLSAVGLVCFQFMRSQDHALMRQVANYLMLTPPQPKAAPHDLYGLYYATIGIFQIGGGYWKRWNEPMQTSLMSMQDPDGSWSHDAYSTALAVLTLEVYYRYAPINPSQ